MTARAGVFVAVRSTHPLADPGRKGAARVFVLKCGHARTGSGKAGARMWCGVCTRKAKADGRDSKRRYTKRDLDRAVAKALADLRAATKARADRTPAQLRRDRERLVAAGLMAVTS